MALNLMDLTVRYEFWRDGVRMMALASRFLLEAANEPLTPKNLIAFVSSLPRRQADLLDPAWRKGYCNACLEKAYGDFNPDDRKFVIDYFLTYFPARSPHCQDMLIDSIVGILQALAEDELAKWPSTEGDPCPTTVKT